MDEHRSPVPGSQRMWTWIAVGLAVLAVFLIVPTLGEGPATPPAGDPHEQAPGGTQDQPADEGRIDRIGA